MSITATLGWRSDVITSRLRTAGLTTVIVARRASRSQLLLQFGDQRQRRHRRHVIDLDGGELLPQRVVVRRRLEQRELTLRIGAGAADRRPAAARELVAFERGEDLARAVDDRG